MKLSKMKNDVLMDILGGLCYQIADLCEDNKIMEIMSDVYRAEDFKEGKVTQLMVKMKGASNYSKIFGYILKEKRDTLHTILSLVNQEELETVKEWNPIITMQKTKELFGDKDFLALLPSQVRTRIEAFQNISTKSE